MRINRKLILYFRFRTFIASLIQTIRNFSYRLRGYDVHPSVIFERKINMDRLYPGGIHIGENCLIASGCTILSHDHCKRVKKQPYLIDTYIGKSCFIAINSIILPGVKIGDQVIVGAGSVVTKNIPSNVIVAGNPARIIREGVQMNDKAEIVNWTLENGWR